MIYLFNNVKVVEHQTKETTTQTSPTQTPRPSNPSILPLPIDELYELYGPHYNRPSRSNLRDIGRGDLNPFGIGGGMLFPDPGMDRPRLEDPGNRYVNSR